jgi:uncharacterized membrane protein YcfT
MTQDFTPSRIDWVDYAKGICIILVVMMHTTLGVEKALGTTGLLHGFIDWARPFRMPDFFLISGLFLARRIDRPWRDYLDSKLVHFLYFYVLWMTIQFLFKGYGIYQEFGAGGLATQYLLAFVEPFGTLWFIYLLPVFFVVTKLARKLPPALMLALAALLEIMVIETGWIMVDEFAARIVYFYAGFALAKLVFRFADDMQSLATTSLLSALFIWGVGHSQVFMAGLAGLPFVGLALGAVGTLAVITAGVVLTRFKLAEPVRYLGANSIVVYLAFFIFMATARSLLVRLVPQLGSDVIALAVTLIAVTGPILLYWATRNSWGSFLFKRPGFARLETLFKGWHSAPHVQLPHAQLANRAESQTRAQIR